MPMYQHPKPIGKCVEVALVAATALNLAAPAGNNLTLFGKDVEITAGENYVTDAYSPTIVTVYQVPKSVSAYNAGVFAPYAIARLGSDTTVEKKYNKLSERFTVRPDHHIWLLAPAATICTVTVRED